MYRSKTLLANTAKQRWQTLYAGANLKMSVCVGGGGGGGGGGVLLYIW